MSDARGNRRWLWAALIGCGVLLVCIALFGTDAGSTWDEPSRSQYGDLILRWFASGFQDTRAVRFENLFFEGGLFEIVAQLIARISPLGVFETRHLVIACVGLIGVVGTGLIAFEIAGPRAAMLAAIALALTPAWVGHSWFNSKDIPFATAATFATWFATRIAKRSGPPTVSDTLGSGISIGAALSVRPGGYFLAAYPLCASLMAIVGDKGWDIRSAIPSVRLAWWRFAKVIPVVWIFMVVAWPWAWAAPVVAPLVAMKLSSHVPFTADTLFRGQLVPPSAVPASYLPIWFAITTPDFYFVAFALGATALAMRSRIKQRINLRAVGVVGIAIILPIGAAVITKPAIYDGLRHFLFVFSPLAALAGIAVSTFFEIDAIPRTARAVGTIALLAGCATTALDMVLIHPYEYAYFNRLFGGLPAANGRFATDYWGASYKEGFAWVVRDARASDVGPIRVASCNESSNKRLEYYRREWADVSDRIVVVPPDAHPDLFLESTRLYLCTRVDGPVIHTVSRLGVPLLYVRKTAQQR